ncbi:NAD(P)H-nitrite reductase [Sphaerochaeta pleomorpha str. Grapes]|uniref:NAD(P)H-nitrite reductase n=1 Tax=Sphaerochaeta pleomorpha (strain ATCC BAA-1885 / DSM 22778 / Grapes) TaxID=158190 RepID=G8QUG4_SPHPG|nr:FAD-dependent oxidoreductase [Sphaerochaeta pleomorpha]AEV29197.1 NAD(P)H-nitrite reductase [Sphaerochaeta pleomorpha str. Grapes]
MRVCVIGNGVAGSMVAERLSSRGVAVTLYTEEPYGFYSRIKLPQLLCDEEGLCALPSTREAPYLVHKAVKKIDRQKQEILLDDGETSPYDFLVLATGSRGRVLDAFANTKGVSTLRTLEDALLISQTLADPVVVLGGGLLGLEAALAILRKGYGVTVCEGASHILARQLDAKASKLLRVQLESDGLVINECIKATGKRVDQDNRIEALVVEGREDIPCKTLILSLGVNAETSLAKDADLEVDRGIVVDEKLRTSDEHIFAIGDCAQYKGQVPGILPVAIGMAQSVMATLLGETKDYIPPVLMTRFKDEKLEIVSVGDVSGASTNKLKDGRYEAYFVEDGKLKGALLYGSVENVAFLRSHYLKAVTPEEIAELLSF